MLCREGLTDSWRTIVKPEEGVVAPGDAVEQVAEGKNRVSVTEMLALMLDKNPDPAALRRLLEVPALAADWRQGFQSWLDG